MSKMYLISAEGYKYANVEVLTIKTTSKTWISMKMLETVLVLKTYLI